MQTTRGRWEMFLAFSTMVSNRSRRSAMNVSAAFERPVAWPNSQMFSKISASECGVIHKISGLGWSNFSATVKSLPDVAQT